MQVDSITRCCEYCYIITIAIVFTRSPTIVGEPSNVIEGVHMYVRVCVCVCHKHKVTLYDTLVLYAMIKRHQCSSSYITVEMRSNFRFAVTRRAAELTEEVDDVQQGHH